MLACAVCFYVGRCESLARFSLVTQGLSDLFKESRYPLTEKERQLTPSAIIPPKNWIVMFGDTAPPKFWSDNVRNFEIGTGIAGPSLGCEAYFTVSQPWYSMFADPSIEIEYCADERSPNQQLATWFRHFLKTKYDFDASMIELIE